MNLGVVGTDHELKLLDATWSEPVFCRRHDLATKPFEAAIRIDADVIDPAAMAVMADQHRGHQRAVMTAEQNGRIALLARERGVGGRVVPCPRRSAALPERNDFGNVAILDRGDNKLHSTLPGFMMPCGSSIALTARISSIAVLSFTSSSSSRLSTPIPCSAEIDPPIRITMSNTTALTSCQRPRKSAASTPIGWLML